MKTIIVTVIDDEVADSESRQWNVDRADDDGKIRAEIGVWLGQFIGKYRYRTSDWIKKPKDDA